MQPTAITCLAQLYVETRKAGLALFLNDEEKHISWTTPPHPTCWSTGAEFPATVSSTWLAEAVAGPGSGRAWAKAEDDSDSQFASWLPLSPGRVGCDRAQRRDFLVLSTESAELTSLSRHTFLPFGSLGRPMSSPPTVQAPSEKETWHGLTFLARHSQLNSGCVSLHCDKDAVECLEHVCLLT